MTALRPEELSTRRLHRHKRGDSLPLLHVHTRFAVTFSVTQHQHSAPLGHCQVILLNDRCEQLDQSRTRTGPRFATKVKTQMRLLII